MMTLAMFSMTTLKEILKVISKGMFLLQFR